MKADLFDLVKKNRSIFWSVGSTSLDKLDESSIIEGILNYGNLESVKELFSILGTEEIAKVFHRQISRKRHNYFPQVNNYFDLYFKRHVPEYTKH